MLSILLGLRPDSKDLERIGVVFKQFDEDSTGNITREKIYKLDTKHKLTDQKHWGKILRNLDLSANGIVDFHDFFTAAVDHRKYLTRENIDYIYKTFDVDGRGYIDLNDFYYVVPSDKWGKILAEIQHGQFRKGNTKTTVTRDEFNTLMSDFLY